MQAIGTTGRRIIAVFIVETAILTAGGVAAGLSGGTVLAMGLSQSGFSSIGTGLSLWTFRLPFERLLLLLALGSAVSLAGAVYPLLKASRIAPVEALKQRGMVLEFVLPRKLYGAIITLLLVVTPLCYAGAGTVLGLNWRPAMPLVVMTTGLFGTLLCLVFLTPSILSGMLRAGAWPVFRLLRLEGFLAVRALTRATDRIAASLMTLAIVFGAVVALKHMTQSLKVQSQKWVDAALTDRVFVSSRLITEEESSAFSDVPGVRQVVPMSFTTPVPFLIRGLSGDLAIHGPFETREDLKRRFIEQNSIVFSSQLAHTLGHSVGDYVSIPSVSGSLAFEVVLVSDEYGYFLDERSYGVVALRNLQDIAPVDTSAAREFALVLEPGADQQRVKDRLYAVVGQLGLNITTGDEKRRFTLDGIDSDFSIFEIILFITALLAGIGVTNALLIGALERKREFGILQALGVTPTQMRRMVLIEGGVIGIIGGMLGVLLGIPLSGILIGGLILLSDLDLSFTLSLGWTVGALAAAVLVSTLAALYPAMKSAAMPVTESIQYE